MPPPLKPTRTPKGKSDHVWGLARENLKAVKTKLAGLGGICSNDSKNTKGMLYLLAPQNHGSQVAHRFFGPKGLNKHRTLCMLEGWRRRETTTLRSEKWAMLSKWEGLQHQGLRLKHIEKHEGIMYISYKAFPEN